ncbi:hypothetical protein FRC10_009003 [Ceratobasidium sp. 414]|nr:hypothetical protein FRC10_009003 [Ceratobasidium sp. 414]
MDDYVFGTAHAGLDIVVYVARWEKRSADSSNKEGDSDPKPKSPVPVAMRSDTSNKSSKPNWLTRRNGASCISKTGKAQPGSELTPALTKDGHASDKGSIPPMEGENDDHEIVVYKLEEFSTLELRDMIQFYLLMRASRQLADTYRAEIFRDKWLALLTEVKTRSQFKWSPQPQPHGKNSLSLGDIAEHSTTGGDLAEGLAVGYNGDADARWEFEPANPEQEAEWKEERGCQRQSAVRRHGPGSLAGFKPAKADMEGVDSNDHVSAYLDSLC